MIFELHFGAMAPKIAEQVEKLGLKFLPNTDIAKIQSLADAVVKLKIHGIATNGEVKKMEQRLAKRVLSHIEVAR
jgi:hypothetical protein